MPLIRTLLSVCLSRLSSACTCATLRSYGSLVFLAQALGCNGGGRSAGSGWPCPVLLSRHLLSFAHIHCFATARSYMRDICTARAHINRHRCQTHHQVRIWRKARRLRTSWVICPSRMCSSRTPRARRPPSSRYSYPSCLWVPFSYCPG